MQQVISALSHLSASHLVIGLETNLPWKEPRSNVPLLSALIPELSGSGKISSEAVPSLQCVITVDNSNGRVDTASLKKTTRWQDVLEDGGNGRRALAKSDLDPNDIVNIQFTSGTTSMPKAACLTHRSILNNGKSIGDRMLLTELDVVCCPPPLFQYALPSSAIT